jgi:hypothetical protein
VLLRQCFPYLGILLLLPVPLLADTFSVEVTIDLTENVFENAGSNVIQITAVVGGVETIISAPAVGTPVVFNPFAPGDSVELTLRTDTASGETPADRGLGRAAGALLVDLFPQVVVSDTLFGDNKNFVDLDTFGALLQASNQVEISGFGSFFTDGSTVKKRLARKTASNISEAFESTGYVNSTIRFEFIPTVVPVPGAVWLFGSALGGLVWLRRKRIDN